MITAAVMAITSFFYNPHAHHAQLVKRTYHLRAWTTVVRHDTFTDAVTCTLAAPRMRYRAATLIFHLRNGLETTHAVFRVDDGPPAPVAAAFHGLEARGFFPRRGWIDNPAGGDVALPAAYVRGARRIWIRATPRLPPTVYDVSRFDDALDRARDAGCPDNGFVDAKS